VVTDLTDDLHRLSWRRIATQHEVTRHQVLIYSKFGMHCAAALAVSAVLYPHLSVQVPLHWDMHLHPDGSFPRWGACLYNLECWSWSPC